MKMLECDDASQSASLFDYSSSADHTLKSRPVQNVPNIPPRVPLIVASKHKYPLINFSKAVGLQNWLSMCRIREHLLMDGQESDWALGGVVVVLSHPNKSFPCDACQNLLQCLSLING
jgi:hypothetical protein